MISKSGELNVSSFVKVPLSSNAILNIEHKYRYRFLWSILAYLRSRENSHPSRVKNYRH